ncbi:MAG: sigma factor-like helix-turn-helix DNA-binding protein [Patescibacteria group bacterium]
MEKINNIIKDLIADLSSRQKDIIESRFGLNGEELTLAAIGEKYNLTRERVRQIENGSLALIKKKFNNSPANKLLKSAVDYLRKGGGIKKDDDFVRGLKVIFKDDDFDKKTLKFIFEIAGKLNIIKNNKNFYDFWYLDAASFKKLSDIIAKAEKFLKARKSEFLSKDMKINDSLSSVEKETGVGKETILNYISVSKKFTKNSFGDFGLSSWGEINPKTMRAKAYLVLKKHSNSLHFRDIAKKINEANFDNRKALEATVHNELIKDPRFVLVGRGIYGLSELGHRPGTAKEVIGRVLKENGPMRAEEVINLVKQERFLKDNTILLNLQNRKNFKKLADGRYHLA